MRGTNLCQGRLCIEQSIELTCVPATTVVTEKRDVEKGILMPSHLRHFSFPKDEVLLWEIPHRSIVECQKFNRPPYFGMRGRHLM
jgi:hypothetical protein